MTLLPLPNGDFTTVEHIERHGPLTVVVHRFRMGKRDTLLLKGN
jgi:hypothetical protein